MSDGKHTSRQETLLEIIRQGLFFSAMQNSKKMLGDRSRYIGMSEISQYAECPRAAIAAKLNDADFSLDRLLTTQRGHWFENGIKDVLAEANFNLFHQLEICIRRRKGTIKAHLDLTLVWDEPVKAVRILEIKSTEKLPDEPWHSHIMQAQGQVNLLKTYWNRPVFSLLNESGDIIQGRCTFTEICQKQLGIELPVRTTGISIESWLFYISMRGAKAFGPFVHSPESHAEILSLAENFHADYKACKENSSNLQELPYPKGFYPLCAYCDANSDCPKFMMGEYQPQWEEAIQRLEELKQQELNARSEIREIELALKDAHNLSQTRDWIDTGSHRFRMSMVAGRKTLNPEALKAEVSEIVHGMGGEIDVEELFASCMKHGEPYSRLTISPINS